MGEHAEGSIVIEASAAEVMDVITDYEAYPEWADVKSASVLQRGEGGLATEVAFEVDVPVLGRASYTLAYRYAPGDAGLSWVTREARGAVNNISGEYLLDELDETPNQDLSRTVRVNIKDPGGRKIQLALPARLASSIAGMVPQPLRAKLNDKGINLDEILKAVQQGATRGPIVDIKDPGGTVVEVIVE